MILQAEVSWSEVVFPFAIIVAFFAMSIFIVYRIVKWLFKSSGSSSVPTEDGTEFASLNAGHVEEQIQLVQQVRKHSQVSFVLSALASVWGLVIIAVMSFAGGEAKGNRADLDEKEVSEVVEVLTSIDTLADSAVTEIKIDESPVEVSISPLAKLKAFAGIMCTSISVLFFGFHYNAKKEALKYFLMMRKDLEHHKAYLILKEVKNKELREAKMIELAESFSKSA